MANRSMVIRPEWPSSDAEWGAFVPDPVRRGRGARSNPSGRFEPLSRVVFDDGWETLDELGPSKTTVKIGRAHV